MDRTSFEDSYGQVPSATSNFSSSPQSFQPFTPPSGRDSPLQAIHIDTSGYSSHAHATAYALPGSNGHLKTQELPMYASAEPRYADTRYMPAHDVGMVSPHSQPAHPVHSQHSHHQHSHHQQHQHQQQQQHHHHQHHQQQHHTQQSQYPTQPLELSMHQYSARPYGMAPMPGQDLNTSLMDVMPPHYGGMAISKSGSISSISSGQLSPVSPTTSSSHYGAAMPGMMQSRAASISQTSVSSMLNTSSASPPPQGAVASWISRPSMYGMPPQGPTLRHNTDYALSHMHSTGSDLRSSGIEVSQVTRGRHPCQYPGCQKAFKRAEHLKRHHATAHSINPEYLECPYCANKRRFLASRIDNYRQHIRLHTIEDKSPQSRVGFDERAAGLLREIESKMKRRGTRKTMSRSSV